MNATISGQTFHLPMSILQKCIWTPDSGDKLRPPTSVFDFEQGFLAIFSGQTSTFCTFLLKYEVELDTIFAGLYFLDALTPYFTSYTETSCFSWI